MTRLIDITGKALAGEWGTDDEMGMGIPVLRTTNFTNEGIVNFDNVVTRTITKKAIENKFLRPGDIILEKSGGSDKQPVGRVIYFDGPPKTYLFNNFTGLLRIQDQKKWYPRYVFYSLFSNYWKGGTRAYENKTTGLHNLKTDDYVSGYNVADADYSRQVEICNYLDEITKIIRLRQQELSKFDDLIKARFVELFGDPIHPVKYMKLGDVALLERGRFSPRPRNDPRFYGGEYPFIQTGDIASSNHRLIEYKQTLNKEGIKVSKKFEVGTIVMAIVGATIGATSILQREVYAPDSVIGISPYKYDNVFLEELLQFWKPHLLAIAPESARANINLGILNDIPIMDVSVEQQNQFADFVNQVDKSKFYEPHWRKTYRMAF